MSDTRLDPEMQALLSGHAAGTLTPEEKKRLHQAALYNQAIFDAMAEEEPLRAALTNSLAKQGLLHALKKIDDRRGPIKIRKVNNWLWTALAACLAISVATVVYWPTSKQATQEVAIATKPQPMSEPTPPIQSKLAPRARANAPASPPPPIPMPAQAPAAVAESTPAKREAESIEAKAIEQPLAPAADSARQETASRAATGNSFRQSNLPPAAKLITANRLAPAEIFNGNLILRADDDNKIYAFLIDGESIKPLSTENDLRRSIPLGTHSAKAEVWLLITATEDPVLARALAGVLPLPSRAWIKLKTNP